MIQTGSLPEGWALTALDEIAAPFAGALTDGPFGSNLKTSHYTDSGPRVIRLQNVGEMVYRGADAHISRDHFETLRRHEAVSGDVVIAMLGDRLPRACQVPAGLGDAIVKADCARLRPSYEMSARYVMYALNSQPVRDAAAGLIHGLGRPRLGLRLLRSLHIPTAPGKEQRRIVEALDSYLSRLDAAQAALERVQTNLIRYRASVLQAAVEGRLVPTEAALAREEGRDYKPASALLERILIERRQRWEEAELAKLRARGKEPKNDKWKAKYKEPAAPDTSALPELPEGWCWAALGQLIVDGPQNGLYVPRTQYGSGVSILRIDDFQSMTCRSRNALQLVDIDETTSARYALRLGDLVINRVNSPSHLGKSVCVEHDMEGAAFESNMMRARLAAGIRSEYIPVYLTSLAGKQRLIANAKWAVNQASINQRDVASTAVPLPPLAEQDNILGAVDDLLTVGIRTGQEMARTLNRLRRLRQSILKWAFEGNLVDQDPNDEPAAALLDRIRAEREANPPKKRTRREKKASA